MDDQIRRMREAMEQAVSGNTTDTANLLRLRGQLSADWLNLTVGRQHPPDAAAPFIQALGRSWSPDTQVMCLQVGAAILVSGMGDRDFLELPIGLRQQNLHTGLTLSCGAVQLAIRPGIGATILVQGNRIQGGRQRLVLIR